MRKTSIILFIGVMLLLGQNGIATAQNGVGVNTTNPKSSFEVNGSFGQNMYHNNYFGNIRCNTGNSTLQ